MRAITTILFAAAPLLSLAAPVRREPAASDLLVLTFASVLEDLETQFYTKAIATFSETDFETAGFSSAQVVTEQLTNIMSDEATHLKILGIGLDSIGGIPLQCSFNFDSVLTDVTTTIATARVVEYVGVAAYLGAAQLIEDPRILESAATILTVEARHQTVLNIMSESSTAIPSAFDMAFSPSEVLAIAGSFISGCDTGIPSNPPLQITNTGTPTAGTLLTFSSAAFPSDTSSLHCQMMIGGAVNSISLPLSQCIVPATVNGPVAIYITSDDQPLLNNVIDRAVSQLVAGPTLVFIDAKAESLSGLVRTGSASSTSTTDSSTSTNSSASTDSSASTNVSSGPILTTGPGPDGLVSVDGWANLPTPSS